MVAVVFMGLRDTRLHTHLASILLAVFVKWWRKLDNFFVKEDFIQEEPTFGAHECQTHTHTHTFSNTVVGSMKDKRGQKVIWPHLIAESKMYLKVPENKTSNWKASWYILDVEVCFQGKLFCTSYLVLPYYIESVSISDITISKRSRLTGRYAVMIGIQFIKF
jgi:hypothetical protein